ncbi:RNA-dependent RNA polymerase [Fusarium mangiferae mitovirus 3]|nr:RNA-dependent RNA polymerase [Fusarium mangiferae mitovirus 3]
MKSIKFILNFKLKYKLKDSILPVDSVKLSRLVSSISKVLPIVLDRTSRIRDRLVIANNFLQFVFKLKKNHGSTFTIKWLKACTVALQKWLGDDKVISLREIEPNLPLPRVINGCPSIINRRDRELMRRGNISIIRFWHSLFSIYRVLSIPGKLKLETITDPFSGSVKFLEDAKALSLNTKWPKHLSRLASEQNLAPTTFHFSGKASPSNVNSSQGILTDIYYLMASEEGGKIYYNILDYLNVVGSKWNTLQFLQRFNDGVKIVELMDNVYPKCSMKNPFGQFAIKKEAAGKVRVFALVDSITQSVMKPLHLALFKVLNSLPNDGTFDQDASVTRCSIKAAEAGKAYSFDLSSATDRLPVVLTGNIIESLFKIPGISQSWQKVMIDRDFKFSNHVLDEFDLPDVNYRYSVGQPMGCLSSWAGLAITHHWVMQFCSFLITKNWDWEERYEVLGDDIVIFDTDLADSYLMVMKQLGLEINMSKSIVSHNRPSFEFAKRTFSYGNLVSGITLSQINSCISISSRINNVYNWIRLGYLNNLETILFVLNNFKRKISFKDFSLMVSSFSLVGLCKNIKQTTLMSCLVDPRKGDLWDIETGNFQVPTRSLVMIARDLITKGESDFALSNKEGRMEWVEESEQLVVAGILQQALYQAKILSSSYEENVKSWALNLIGPKGSPISEPLLPSMVEGWLMDSIVDNRNSKIVDPFEIEDKVENTLIYHAKTQMVTLERAYDLLHEVESLEYVYKQPTKKTQKTYNRLGNQSLKDMSRPFISKGPQYWSIVSPNKS